jgi:hypothetical protein
MVEMEGQVAAVVVKMALLALRGMVEPQQAVKVATAEQLHNKPFMAHLGVVVLLLVVLFHQTATGANGGNGTTNSITGPSVGYAGGGGGGNRTSVTGNGGDGGSGGGGDGGGANHTSSAGDPNTGGGGGGHGFGTSDGKAGGSGIVVIKIPDTRSASFSAGVTQTSSTAGGFTVFTVTATSTTSETVIFS